MTLRFDLHAAGVLAPGIASLAELRALRRSGHAPATGVLQLPSPEALPAIERRRASQVVRLTMACAAQALRTSPFAADALRLVFASDEGTGEVCQKMLEALNTTRLVSPLLFHNSVHNAPSGYLSIGYQNHQPATSVSLGQQSFASGLLCAASEACASGQPVLLLAYDAPMTEPLSELLPITHATASAWIIASGSAATSGPAPLASFSLSLHPGAPADPAQAGVRPDAEQPTWLPAAWAGNSSARALVALALLDDTREHPSCELRLGAQWLRLERSSGSAVC